MSTSHFDPVQKTFVYATSEGPLTYRARFSIHT